MSIGYYFTLALFLLASSPVRADPAPPIRAPVVAPAPAPEPAVVPVVALDPRMPLCPPAVVPVSFGETTAGKVLTYISAIGAGLVSASASFASIAASWPR